MYEWNEEKSAKNLKERGFGFDIILHAEWEFAYGPGFEYYDGEEREIWIVPIGSELFVVVTTRRGERTRIISLRRASNPEKIRWKNEFYHD